MNVQKKYTVFTTLRPAQSRDRRVGTSTSMPRKAAHRGNGSRRAAASNDEEPESDTPDEIPAGQYKVEYIINHRKHPSGIMQFFVKWAGKWKYDERTWQDEDSLTGCTKCFVEYWTKVKVSEAKQKELIEQDFPPNLEPLNLTGINPYVPSSMTRGFKAKPPLPRKVITAPKRLSSSEAEQVSSQPATRSRIEETFLRKDEKPDSSKSVVKVQVKPKGSDSRDTQWAVDYIMGTRVNGSGHQEFLVKWKGFDVSESTWEPSGNLKQAMGKVEDFYAAYSKPSKRNTMILTPEGQGFLQFHNGY